MQKILPLLPKSYRILLRKYNQLEVSSIMCPGVINLLFLKITYARSSGVRNFAVSGKSTNTTLELISRLPNREKLDITYQKRQESQQGQ